MSFFDKKNAIDAASKKRAGGKAAAGMAAAAVAAGGAVLASEAGAAALANVASYALNDDGSVTVTYADGSTATYAAGSFEIIGDQVHVGSNAVLIAGGVAGLAALAALALSSAEASAAAATAGADVRGLKGASDDGDDADAGDDAGDDADAGDDDASTGTFTEAGNTGSDDPATVLQPLLSTTTFDVSNATNGDLTGISDLVFVDNVDTVTLAGDDTISLIDVDGNTGALSVSNLDGGDRLEIEDDVTTLTLATESGAEQDNPLIVSLEGATVTTLNADAAGNLEGLRIEATGDAASTVSTLTAGANLESLELAGDQAISVTAVSGTTGLTTIDASGATGGVTIGQPETATITTAVVASAADLGALESYIGSEASDDLVLNAVFSAAATIDTAGGDDDIDLDGTSTANITVSAGAGADVVDLGGMGAFVAGTNEMVVDLGAADGAVDDVIVNGNGTALIGVNALTIQNFEAGIDTLDLSQDGLVTNVNGTALTTVAVADGDTTGTDVVLNAGLNIIADALTVTDLGDGALVLAALANDYDFASTAATEQVYVMVTDGTDSALYNIVNAGGAGAADIDAADTAVLVAEFEAVSDMSALTGSSTSFVDFA